MDTNYCLFVDRRIQEGEDFTDLPFGDLEKLTKVAEAALRVPYVTKVSIKRKTNEIDGLPWWGYLSPSYERDNPNANRFYTTEEQFKQDLRLELQDEQLFEQLYRNKLEWKRFVESH